MATRSSTLRSKRSRRRRPTRRWPTLAAMIGGGIGALVALTWWGDPSRSGSLFWESAGLSLALLGSLALLLWWLFLSPLPAGVAVVARPNAAVRQVTALLATVSGALFVGGATWSQMWGTPHQAETAGAETWSQPELLLLGSSLVAALAALTAFIFVARQSSGLRQRFRADPLAGGLGIVAAYAALTMLAGLLWPQDDSMTDTARRLPHLLAALNVALLMLTAAAVQGSLLPWRATWTPRRLGLKEIHVVVQLAIVAAILLPAFGVEDGVLAVGGALPAESGPLGRAFPARPATLYPALVLTIGLFVGNVALQLLRRPGAALLVMLAVLCYRALMLTVSPAGSSGSGSPAAAEFLLLVPAAGLDLIYYFRQQAADDRQTWLLANLTSITLLLTLGLVLLPRLLPDLPFTGQTISWAVVVGVPVGLWAGWVGEATGAALGRSGRQPS